ncbi:hypothetical protein IRP63_14290 (plasmid) [Clostridium botulinum]|uniref:Uncharacterized protein n=1 Tax=Clostridium botulinum C/D str. DC5 TaxID=1443128 RepID=A0A0A0HYE9_CLOBO|nr:hypothetical protein [Clostridium botulinum]KGM93448.1 hypothetical protein Z955_14975 [Clostridium botulinum C/D str. DC5]KOC56845.1 hypothetical protein ADU89_01185 [Clostridium botulinum]KOC57320.1 hypothetical protein ADU90_05725 [Clostridium botulinum]MCD3232547.1 hypothetical protein [Clostridium botulinum D/C]MCD3238524.1 hypothetical protein [Clostridium botulinum D/C]
MLENVKIQDREKLKIHCKKLKQFQKEMRYTDMQNIDELQEEYIKYITEHRPYMTLEQLDTVSEVFEFMRKKIVQNK